MTERKIKKVKYANEPVYVTVDGTTEPYIPKDIITNREAYATSLHMLFKHVADFHLVLVDIIAEKTGLDSNDIMSAITEDPRYTGLVVDPKIHSFGLLEKKDVEKVVPVSSVEDLEEKMTNIAIDEKPKKTPKPKVLRKKD